MTVEILNGTLIIHHMKCVSIFRCIQLHTKCQPVPSPGHGQPLSVLPVPHLTDQPSHLNVLLPPDRLRSAERKPCCIRLLLASQPATQWGPGVRKPSHWNYCLQPVSGRRGGGEQQRGPNHQTGRELHCDADFAQCWWLSWPQLPQPCKQHFIAQL